MDLQFIQGCLTWSNLKYKQWYFHFKSDKPYGPFLSHVVISILIVMAGYSCWSVMTWFYRISSSLQLQTRLNTTKSSLIIMIMLLRWLFPYDMNADLKTPSDAPSKGDRTGRFTTPQRGACSPFFAIFLSPSLTNQDCFCDKQSPLILSLFFLNYNEEL